MSKLSTLDNPLERISGADKPKENPFLLKWEKKIEELKEKLEENE